MHHINGAYTTYYNKKQERSGHLFQGRYKAILIDPEPYLLDLVRQIHLLPVRDGLQGDPMQHPWSSHRAYCGREKVLWLNSQRTLLQIDETGIRALMKFHSYVNEGLQQEAAAD